MEKDAKKIDKRLLRLIIASILVVASSSVGLIAGFKIASSNPRVVTVKDQSKFDEIINILENNWMSDIYYKKDVDTNLLIDQFIGALQTDEQKMLDPYTSLSKKVAGVIDIRGKIGVTLTNIAGYPVIIGVDKDTAADGILQKGDIVIGAGKENDEGNIEYHYANDILNTYNSIFNKVAGLPGEDIYLKYYRLNDENKLILNESKITYGNAKDPIYATLEDCNIDDTIMVKYTSFVDSSNELLSSSSQLEKILQENKSKNLILDLRDNGGGDLSSVLNVASLFLDKGQNITTLEYKNKKETYNDNDDKKYEYDHIYILQNGNTASASEILISALTYHLADKVTLIGTKSYGKGIGQRTVSVLDNKYQLKYTCSKWYRPDGSWIGMSGSQYEVGYPLGFTPDTDNYIKADDNLAIFEILNSSLSYKENSDDYTAFKDDNVNVINGAFFNILNVFYNTNGRVDCYYDNTNMEAIKQYQTIKSFDNITGVMDEFTYVNFVSDMYNARINYQNKYIDRVEELING